MQPVPRLLRFLGAKGDRFNTLRRHMEMRADQAFMLARQRLLPSGVVPPFDGHARFSLVTVNFSTTRFLKLLLLTLTEQAELSLVRRLVIVDNDSRDGGLPFLRRLALQHESIVLVENRWFPHHARGVRLGYRKVDELDRELAGHLQSNVLLTCDSDVILRRSDTLRRIAECFDARGAAFVGELRHGLYPYPEAQASFFAIRRDVYSRSDVAPLVNHGAPAYWMQRSLWRAELPIEDFPSNWGGYILHRGRSGVQATRTFRRHDPHATAPRYQSHYMGVPDGAKIWDETEARFAHLLTNGAEPELLRRLRDGLGPLGSAPTERP